MAHDQHERDLHACRRQHENHDYDYDQDGRGVSRREEKLRDGERVAPRFRAIRGRAHRTSQGASGGYHKEFYVRATVRAAHTRAAHLLLRMSPGHSRCALTASPAQRGSTHRFPRYCTRHGRVADTKTREPGDFSSSSRKWRLPTLPQMQYHRRC